MDNPIRVLIADDHMIVRQGVRLILETDEGVELDGEAADGGEAVRLAGELLPDVVYGFAYAGHGWLDSHRSLAPAAPPDRGRHPHHLQGG